MKIFSLIAAIVMVAIFGIAMNKRTEAQNTQGSAGGHGTILVLSDNGETIRRQFSFSVTTLKNGRVKGNAVLHNAAFSGENGKKYQSNIEISCIKVVGNYAVLGGTVRRTNDPNLSDSAFFIVQDNGEPGNYSDKISSVYFDSQVGPETCQATEINAFPLMPIEAGNINVKK